jgi:hypothetical protein
LALVDLEPIAYVKRLWADVSDASRLQCTWLAKWQNLGPIETFVAAKYLLRAAQHKNAAEASNSVFSGESESSLASIALFIVVCSRLFKYV